MKKYLMIIFSCAILLHSDTSLYSWELLDRIIAIVNTVPIIDSEVLNKLNVLKKIRKVPDNRILYEKSRILDAFIEKAIVYETAVNEAIVVSDKSVFSLIEKMLRQFFGQKGKSRNEVDDLAPMILVRLESRINGEKLKENKKLDPSVQEFIKYIEDNQKQSFEDFFEDTKNQIRKEQVMSIAIGVSPPTRKEALDWYKKNVEQFGPEVYIKHILIRPAKDTATELRNVNNTLEEIRKRIIAGESFENLAMMYSQDAASAKKGGDLGWVMLAELDRTDKFFAGNVNYMNRIGQISPVFRSGMGYHIVKLIGRRPVEYEKVENMIMYKLYGDNMEAQFKKWIDKKRSSSAIKIFMAEYVKEVI